MPCKTKRKSNPGKYRVILTMKSKLVTKAKAMTIKKKANKKGVTATIKKA